MDILTKEFPEIQKFPKMVSMNIQTMPLSLQNSGHGIIYSEVGLMIINGGL